MKVSIEVAELASKLGLSHKQVANLKVAALLRDHLVKTAKPTDGPPEMPKRPPGAVSGWRWKAYRDVLAKPDAKKLAAKELELDARERALEMRERQQLKAAILTRKKSSGEK